MTVARLINLQLPSGHVCAETRGPCLKKDATNRASSGEREHEQMLGKLKSR